MDENYYPPRLTSFFIFLIFSTLLITSSIFVFLKSQKPPSIKIPYIPPPEQAVNWKTYSGSGLSFRYPTEWADAQTSPLSTRTLITIPDKLEITYGSYYNQFASREMTIDEYIQSQSFNTNQNFSSEKISMSDFQGYRFTHLAHNANYFITTLVLAKTGVPSNILLIVYQHDNSEYASTMPPTLSRLLSTFKFPDPQCISNSDCSCHCCQREADSATKLNKECPLINRSKTSPQVSCVFDGCYKYLQNYQPACQNNVCVWTVKK